MQREILLIVNADDFGLAEGVNQAVAEAFDRGVLRSASLLAGGDFAEEAVGIAMARSGLGVGVHLALTQVKPVLPPNRLPGLTGGRDVMPEGPRQFIQRLFAGKISRREIVAEFGAQVEKALDLGVKVTHFDSHQHLHLLPKVREAFAQVAEKFTVRHMRMPRLGGPSRSMGEWSKALAVHFAHRLALPVFKNMVWPDCFWGLACSGEFTLERMIDVVKKLAPGTHELMCHPAANDATMRERYHWQYFWEQELSALRDPDISELILKRGIRLGNFGDL